MPTPWTARLRGRALCWIAIPLAVALAAGCSDDGESDAPPGSAANPVAAEHEPATPASGRNNEAAAGTREGDADAGDGGAAGEGGAEEQGQPGFEELVERQSARPRSRFSPCNLVTRAEAHAIVREPLEAPFEAPQGPTCIYQGRSGSPFITVAVQELDLARVERRLRKRRRVDVAGRTAYCGSHGREMLYVPVDTGRVLSISSRCDIAMRFAARALPRLPT